MRWVISGPVRKHDLDRDHIRGDGCRATGKWGYSHHVVAVRGSVVVKRPVPGLQRSARRLDSILWAMQGCWQAFIDRALVARFDLSILGGCYSIETEKRDHGETENLV